MIIKASASIRQNYNEISELCKATKEPVYLTKNGEGDLVVMDIESFSRREKMLKLREELLAIEEERMRGAKYYSIDEIDEFLDNVIEEVSERAKRNLAKIVTYIAIENPSYSRKIKAEIIAAMKSLSRFPERCPFFEGEFIPYNKYHKFVVASNFIFLYIVQDDVVIVEHIIDCRQDYQWLIR